MTEIISNSIKMVTKITPSSIMNLISYSIVSSIAVVIIQVAGLDINTVVLIIRTSFYTSSILLVGYHHQQLQKYT